MGRGRIHLWRALQDPGQPSGSWIHDLSQSERIRAQLFHFDLHRNRFVFRHWFLRTVLGAYLKARPAAIRFTTEPGGKPSVDSPRPLSFSLTHSQSLVLLAISEDRSVGLDVEFNDASRDWTEVAKRLFSLREINAFMDLPMALRTTAFFHAWTRKEAYAKALGLGLAVDLQGFAVELEPGRPPALLEAKDTDATRWRLWDIPVGPEYTAALAIPDPGPVEFACWDWSPDWAERQSLRIGSEDQPPVRSRDSLTDV